MIIDTHREAAECNRKLWNRIWIVLWVSIGVLAFGAWYSVAQAEPVKVYPGFKLAWDYEWTVPGGGFPIQVNGQWAARAGPDAREFPVAALNLVDGPQLIQIRARAEDGRMSPWAGVEIVYSSVMPDPLPMPGSIRIIMEWTADEQIRND